MYARQPLLLFLCAAACGVLFVLLAIAVTHGLVAGFDAGVRGDVHAFNSRDLTIAAQLFSLLGSARVWLIGLAAVLAALWWKRERRRALGLAAVMGGATILDNGLKLLLHRARPAPFFGLDPDTFSFPSGHALFSLCFYGTMAAIFASQVRNAGWRVAIWTGALALVLCIGLSRIYLGVHYPSDVMAGYLIGGAWLSVACASGLLRARLR